MTKNDINFLSHINEGLELENDFNYKLTFISEIIKRIRPSNFSHSALLNIDLIIYCIQNEKNEVIENIVSPFELDSKIKHYFFHNFSEKEEYFSLYLQKLEQIHKNLVEKTLENEFSDELKSKIIFSYILSLVNIDKLESYKKNNLLINFLNSSIFLFDSGLINTDDTLFFLKTFNLKIKDLIFVNSQKILSEINQNSRYEINYSNIKYIINKLNRSNEFNDINFALYSSIINSSNSYLIDYIHSNFILFLENIYTYLPLQKENENSFIKLLKHCIDNKVDSKLGSIIITNTDTIVSKLETIDHLEFQDQLLSLNRIEPNWENICKYFSFRNEGQIEKFDFTDTLIDFIILNITNNHLIFSKLEEGIMSLNKITIKLLKQNLLLNDKIQNDVFEKMIKEESEDFISEIPLETWGIAKLKILILNSKLQFNEFNTAFIREAHSDLFIDYCISNFSSFFDKKNEFELDNLDLEKIIKSDKLGLTDKIEFISTYSFLNHSHEKLLPKSIIDFVLENKVSFLYQSYSNFENLIEIIKRSEKTDLSKRQNFLLVLLFAFEKDKEKIKQIILAFNEFNFRTLFDKNGTTQRFEQTNYNNKVIEILKKNNLIGKVKVSKNDILIYKKNITKK